MPFTPPTHPPFRSLSMPLAATLLSIFGPSPAPSVCAVVPVGLHLKSLASASCITWLTKSLLLILFLTVLFGFVSIVLFCRRLLKGFVRSAVDKMQHDGKISSSNNFVLPSSVTMVHLHFKAGCPFILGPPLRTKCSPRTSESRVGL